MPTLPIVGDYFRPPAKAFIAALPVGAKLILRAEPDNAYDPNAIAVHLHGPDIPPASHEELERQLQGFGFTLSEALNDDWHLGYLPRDLAAEQKALGFPEGEDVPGTFSVSARGKGLVRFDY